MRERMKRIGGELTVESAPGAGTRLYITIPLGEPVNASGSAKTPV
jgi:signal transduction histidine kinase